MIVATLNQKGDVGKTTLALHLAGHWARQAKRVTLIDADPQAPALDWSEQRPRRGLERVFGVIGLARAALYREALEFAHHADNVVIGEPPRVAALLRSALFAADAVLVPAQPSPFDDWASTEMPALIAEARVFRAALVARLVRYRCLAHDYRPREGSAPRRSRSPGSPRMHRPVSDLCGHRAHWPACGRAALATASLRARSLRPPHDRKTRAMTAWRNDGGFAFWPRDAESWVKARDRSPSDTSSSDLHTGRLTLDIAPALRDRIEIAAFQRGETVADVARAACSRVNSPNTDGGQS